MLQYLKNLFPFFYHLVFHFAFVWNSKIGKNTTIREGASIYDSNVGDNCYIGKSVNIYGATLGNYVKVGAFVEIQKDVEIGSRSVISSHSFLCSGVKIGGWVFVGHNVTTIDDKFPIAYNKNYKREKTMIENFVSIGSSCTLMGGIKLGAFSMLGANSFLNKDLPANQLWYGGPATFRRIIADKWKSKNYKKEIEKSLKFV